MKHYQLTSTLFIGAVDLYFSDSGILQKFDCTGAELSEKNQLWILRQMPSSLDKIQLLIGNSTTAKINEVTQTINFDMFWDKYDDKLSSSKKKSLLKWNKMPEAERLKAFNFIGRYFNSIASGTRKKYVETYLNAELWNN